MFAATFVKISLSPLNDKRYIQDDRITSYAYKNEKMNKDIKVSLHLKLNLKMLLKTKKCIKTFCKFF